MAWYAELKRIKWYCINGIDMIQIYKQKLEILPRIQKDMQKHFDDEIRKSIMGATTTSDFQMKSGEDIISDLNDMICKMTTLIICSPKNKELLEKRKDKLPHMTKILPNPYLEDDKIYVITDEELKKNILKHMEIVKGDN